jgi:hypothetical protein
MTYDPGLKYELTDAVREADLARSPALLRHVRERLAADLDDYPGILVWTETIRGGVRVITGTKYPPGIAERIIEARRGAALRGEDAA